MHMKKVIDYNRFVIEHVIELQVFNYLPSSAVLFSLIHAYWKQNTKFATFADLYKYSFY